jgi:hypothetical protein
VAKANEYISKPETAAAAARGDRTAIMETAATRGNET